MNTFSQFQNIPSNKLAYSELHKTYKNQTQNTQKNHSEHEYYISQKISAKPHRINESLNSELSQDLLKEVKAKNEILSAQLEEYKVLVINMQKKMGQLEQQNKQLNEKLTILSKQNEMNSKFLEYQKQSFMQTVPMHNLFKQNKQQEQIMSCQEINQILTKFQTNNYEMGHSKTQVVQYLSKMVKEKHEMQNFIDNLWELKDKIEPGNELYLYQLWRWVKVVAINYFQLKQYKNSKDKKQNHQINNTLLQDRYKATLFEEKQGKSMVKCLKTFQ